MKTLPVVPPGPRTPELAAPAAVPPAAAAAPRTGTHGVAAAAGRPVGLPRRAAPGSLTGRRVRSRVHVAPQDDSRTTSSVGSTILGRSWAGSSDERFAISWSRTRVIVRPISSIG